MQNQSILLPTIIWPYGETLIRLLLSLVLGLLIGLERERRDKEAGLRTFGFIALLGGIGGAMGDNFALLSLFLVGLLTYTLNMQLLHTKQTIELTTSTAMLITCFAGILCGQGHTISPAAIMVIVTALLALKEPLSGFSVGLTESELRSALLLAILAIVIYPALPSGSIGPGKLIDPRATWVTVILISSIGFANYVLLKIYGVRGTEISGFLGGLVNSNFTVIELAGRVKDNDKLVDYAYRSILLATTAMLARNAMLLLILAPNVLLNSWLPFTLMFFTSAVLVLISYRSERVFIENEPIQLKLGLPFSLWIALKYGFVFLVIHIFGTISQNIFGETGFYTVSLIGGLMSSASAVAASANLASHGSISAALASKASILASFTSIAFSLSFVLQTRNGSLIRKLVVSMFFVAVAGLTGTIFSEKFLPLLIGLYESRMR
ncbi:MgtC/SapB family protein [Candidatus Methylobacter oryzae]|uniref:MgtC/SapB family protein n=1 Tax=Candidatus Methylobacter oryzae TaxID=2497749 RepID=A0ABY3CE27_9GAMM|nr:MgtC/SapB family protein [Candidatus Methylobacter oryzae]TRX00050.1 MgtC/SapB family protein [Candidatus Methylobacter oryzae]